MPVEADVLFSELKAVSGPDRELLLLQLQAHFYNCLALSYARVLREEGSDLSEDEPF